MEFCWDSHLENSRVSELLDDQRAGPAPRSLGGVRLDALDEVRLRLAQLHHQVVQLPSRGRDAQRNVFKKAGGIESHVW